MNAPPPEPIDLAREPDFRLGGLEVRPSTREVVCGEAREVLEPRIMQVLVALARRHGEVVSRDDLIASCWGGRVVGEDAIQRAVAGVRRLGEANAAFAVETVARVGYRLVETEATGQGFWRRPRAPAWAWAAAALLVVAGGGWLAWSRLGAPPAPAEIKVAVLPFDMIGADPSVHNFAGGLLDAVVGALSSNQVEAVSRTESLKLRGPGADAMLARLGVGLVLDGAVEGDGKTLKIRVHLEDARAHVTLWSHDFQGPVADAQALETRVAAHATDVTKWALSPTLNGARADQRLVAAYLQGMDEISNEGGGRGLTIAREIVARAPRFAPGHYLLSTAVTDMSGLGSDFTPAARDQAVAESIKEAKIALALDPTDGRAYRSLALLTPISAWGERERLFLKGLAIVPNDASMASLYAMYFLRDVGRSREAFAMGKRAVAGEPFAVWQTENMAVELVGVGQTDEAKAAMAGARRLWPDYWEVPLTDFFVNINAGDYPRALAMLDEPALQAVLGQGTHGKPAASGVYRKVLQLLASSGATHKADAARLIATAADEGVIGHKDAAPWLSALGDIDGAFREADRAFTPEALREPDALAFNYAGATGVLFDPGTASMRQDRRFMTLAARVGLVDYWRTSGHWPDFCSEPGLPYDCKAEAAKLSVVKPRP